MDDRRKRFALFSRTALALILCCMLCSCSKEVPTPQPASPTISESTADAGSPTTTAPVPKTARLNPWKIVGQQWDPSGLREAAQRGRAAFAVERNRCTTVRLDDLLGKADRISEGTFFGSEPIYFDITKAEREGPLWRFPEVRVNDSKIGNVLVEINYKPENSSGYFFLVWHYDETKVGILKKRNSLKVYLEPGRNKYLLTPSTNHGLNKNVSISFSFHSLRDMANEIEFISLAILPKNAPYSDETVGVSTAMLDGEIRPVVYQWTTGDVAFLVRILDSLPVFKTGTGLLPESPAAKFTISVEESGKETTVFESAVGQPNLWSDLAIDLSAWKGRQVRLHLKAESVPPTVAMWSSPRIVSRGREKRLFCIILDDALRSDFVQGYPPFRGRVNPTPNLLALARDGVTFLNAFSNAGFTRFSVPTIFTGLLPYNSGIVGFDRVSEATDTMAEIFRREGFMTASLLFNGNAGRETNLQSGFDHVFTPFRLIRENERLNIPLYPNPESRHLAKLATYPVTEARHMFNDFLFRFIRDHEDEDMFLYLHLMDNHKPYLPQKRFRGGFEKVLNANGIVPPSNGTELYKGVRSWRNKGWPSEAVLELYRGAAQAADYHVGRFVRFLRSEGLYKNTTLVFTADHGEHLGDRDPQRLFAHGNPLTTSVLKVPFILTSPALFAGGKKVIARVQLSDLMPTLLDIAGINYDPDRFDGGSLLSLVAGQRLDWFERRPIISNGHSSAWSVLLESVHCPEIGSGTLVYDWSQDPSETSPLDDPQRLQAYQQLIESLRKSPRRDIPDERERFLIRDQDVTQQLRALGYLR